MVVATPSVHELSHAPMTSRVHVRSVENASSRVVPVVPPVYDVKGGLSVVHCLVLGAR